MQTDRESTLSLYVFLRVKCQYSLSRICQCLDAAWEHFVYIRAFVTNVGTFLGEYDCLCVSVSVSGPVCGCVGGCDSVFMGESFFLCLCVSVSIWVSEWVCLYMCLCVYGFVSLSTSVGVGMCICLWETLSFNSIFVWAYKAVFGVSSRLYLSFCVFLSVFLCLFTSVHGSLRSEGHMVR